MCYTGSAFTVGDNIFYQIVKMEFPPSQIWELL